VDRALLLSGSVSNLQQQLIARQQWHHPSVGQAEISINLAIESSVQLSSESIDNVETTVTLTADSSFQLASLKLNFPLVDALLALARQISSAFAVDSFSSGLACVFPDVGNICFLY